MNRKMLRAMKSNPKLQEKVYIDGREMTKADAIEYYETCIRCIPKQTASDSIENSRRNYIKGIKYELYKLYKGTGLTNPYAKFRNFNGSRSRSLIDISPIEDEFCDISPVAFVVKIRDADGKVIK